MDRRAAAKPGTSDTSLAGVTVLSPCDAWAVGSFRSGGEDQTLILRWNGTVWKQVSRPSPGSSFSVLKGVRVVSARRLGGG